MKVHIALIGKQTLPIFIPALNIAPENVFLIYSEKTKEAAMTIQSKLFQLRKDQIKVNSFLFDPVDIKEIKKSIKKLKEFISPDDEVSVNLSGGTKTWSIVFYQMFNARKNTTCFYLDQNGYIWDFKTEKATETTTSNVSLTDLCALHNIDIESSIDIKEYDESDDECLDEIRKLYDFNTYSFCNLTNKMYDTGGSYVEIEDGSSIERDRENYSIDLTNYGFVELNSTHIEHLLFNTGWFEYLVARLLYKWKQQREIFLNVKFRLIETGVEINEVDIVVRTKNKYLFVECKTSAYSPSDVDKFNDVAENYGGIATKRIFVTYKEPSKRNEEKFQKYSTVISKCKKLKMPFFVYKDIIKDTRMFYEQLDQYMAELNE